LSNKLIYKHIYLDGGAQTFLSVLLLVQLFFVNGFYLLAGLVLLGIIVYHLQQPLKPASFTIIFIYHLIQVMSGVWLSNYVEKDVNFRSDHMATATWFSYIGLVFMFTPIIYYQNKIPNISLSALRKQAENLSINKTFNTYIIAFFVTNALGGLAFLVAGLSQVIFSFVNIKWFFFLLFGFQVVLKKKMIKQFVFFVLLEFLMGFFSYFSDFKTVILFTAFLAIVFLSKIYLKQVIIACITLIFLFYLAVMWTSIKGEYRVFLNKGSKSQTVQVAKEDALNKLIDLSNNQKEGTFKN